MFGLFGKKLPHCDDLFVKYLSPWYPKEERPKMTRPDMYIIAGYEGHTLELDNLQYLTDEGVEHAKNQLRTMVSAALEDYQSIIKSDKLDLKVLDAVDKFHDRKCIKQLINSSDRKEFSNSYLVAVCELGAMLGHLFNEHEGFGWLYSYPYFHSIIVHKETGMGITVFDWAVKKFSEYGVDDGLVDKFHAAFEGIKDYRENKE